MPQIQILSEDLVNKIAAGEVIERPASVVKELIENSLDAQATNITIAIEDSGKKLIRVSDNGQGMDKEDAQMSVFRHSTSKIKDETDLFAITSLGFRGEALASIAAVSQLSIITKQTDQMEGFNLVVEGGSTVSSGILAAKQGTTIEVRQLFFNTPARKKFLKSDPVELRHIIDVVVRYALINPEISFNLMHEGHNLLNSPAVSDLRSNIASLYGTKLAKELLEIDYQNEDQSIKSSTESPATPSIKVTGFIAPPSHARNDKNQQFLFVNGRWVRHSAITQAVYDAFHSLLFVNRHPIMVLNLELDPKEIDVNVHPAKTEIKIEQQETVCNAVFTAVKQTLQKNKLIPSVDVEAEKQATFGLPSVKETGKKEEKGKAGYLFEKSKQSIFPIKISWSRSGEKEEEPTKPAPDHPPPDGAMPTETAPSYPPLDEAMAAQASPRPPAPGLVEEEGGVVFSTESGRIPEMKLLGQIHKTFFAAETDGGLFLLDQHAVHERVLYEKFMEEYLNKDIARQTLLKGDLLEFSPTEKAAIVEFKDKLNEFGFLLEEFGENAFVVKTIPALLGRTQPKEMVYEILTKLEEGKSKPEEVQEEIIIRMACRSAVMAGEELTLAQMEGYLKELTETKLPWTCPHGRPTMFKISVDELEKKFKRKG